MLGRLVRGEVAEYCSPELGLVTLSTGHTVLFHRNQVRIHSIIPNNTHC